VAKFGLVVRGEGFKVTKLIKWMKCVALESSGSIYCINRVYNINA